MGPGARGLQNGTGKQALGFARHFMLENEASASRTQRSEKHTGPGTQQRRTLPPQRRRSRGRAPVCTWRRSEVQAGESVTGDSLGCCREGACRDDEKARAWASEACPCRTCPTGPGPPARGPAQRDRLPRARLRATLAGLGVSLASCQSRWDGTWS